MSASNYYEILGVSKKASQDDLKDAYRKAAKKNDPLKGGDPEKFKAIGLAYAVLSVPKKRELYDLQNQDLVIPQMVSLEDLYNGSFKKHRFSHLVICSKCEGKGSKSGESVECSGCVGAGMMFNFTTQQMQRCYQCCGTGHTISEAITDEDRCEHCKGEKFVKEMKVFEIRVQKGMQNVQEFRFPKEVIHTKSGGGAVFILQQEEHPIFKRKGDDLFVEHTLSLMEALSGNFQFVLTHLDDRKLKIKSQLGEVVKPGQLKVINDEGMPVYQSPTMRGNLYIRFTVYFPDSLPPELKAGLSSPQVPDMEVVDEGVKTTLRDVNTEDERRWKQYDEDKDVPGPVATGGWVSMSAAIDVAGNGGGD